MVARSGGGYKKKRRFKHVSESYPPLKLDDKPTYYRVSDLHVRVYRMYRVYRSELSQQTIEELLRRLRKMVIFYGLDGYVYVYLVSEAYRISKAVEKLNIAENMLTHSLYVDIVEEDPTGSNIASFDLNSDRINMVIVDRQGIIRDFKTEWYPEVNRP